MKIGKKVYVTKRKEWRSWLSKNYNNEKEIWLVYYKKDSGRERIPYNDCVEEALCYGWIDGIVKGIDEEKFAQRFTPRRKSSFLSEMNKERVRRLIKSGKMTHAGLKAIEHAFDKNNKEHMHGNNNISPDIIKKFKKNKVAWKNFQSFPKRYRRIRVAYVESQRKHDREMFKRSLNNLIKMSERNKMFGMVR